MINPKTTNVAKKKDQKLDRSIKKEDLRPLTVAELANVAGGAGFAQTTLMVRNDLRAAAANLALRAVCSGCHGC